MRRLIYLSMTNLFVLLAATTWPGVPARADAMTDELRQDEQAYNAIRAQLSADELAGTAQVADQHRYRLAILKLRQDRGIIAGPNEHEHQEKQGRSKP